MDNIQEELKMKDLNEEEELQELDVAITQALEFLGQVYVSLQSFHAIEGFLCDQYATSIHFVLRCLSKFPSSKALSHEHRKSPTCNNRSWKTEATDSQENLTITQSKINQSTTQEGPVSGSNSDDSWRLKAIVSLCESIDAVLFKAKGVSEKSTSAKACKIHKILPKPSSEGDVCVTTFGDTRAASSLKSTTSNKVITHAKTRGKAKKLVPRELNKVQRRLSKSLKPTPRNVQACNDCNGDAKEDVVRTQLTKDCQPLETNSSTIEGRNDGFANESTSTGNKKCERLQLQFPERVCTLLSWFKSRGISLDDPLSIPRAEAQAAKENFLSILNEVNNQQVYPHNKESKEAVVLMGETQGVLKGLASHVSPFEMSWLLRAAPRGSIISKQRDAGMHNAFKAQLHEGATLKTGRCQVTYSGVMTPLCRKIRPLSWLPQTCWPYFGQAMESLRIVDNKECGNISQTLQTAFNCYTNPEHVLVMARLWHVIQVTLFQCHMEYIVAAPLLPNKHPRSEPSLATLFQCRLAHSILCKEGCGLMVMAERLLTPY